VRPRLLHRLDESLSLPLTLISAPAGFGKSTLVNQWVYNRAVPELADRNGRMDHTAWFSIDEDDDVPVRFWEYLLAALEMGQPDHLHLETAHLLLQGQPIPPAQALLTDVINQIASLDEELLLVLDDFQFIHAPEILEGITFLVEHLPPRMHILLLTRSDPSLPLGRWRIRGQLNEIRTADLRFTLGEATDYLRQVQILGLSEQDVLALEERTEGWIAGLQMAGLSLRDLNPVSLEKFINEFTGQHHMILDYLTDEVLHRQPEDIQDFLLKTSILSQLCPGLCAALVNGVLSHEDTAPQEGKYIRLLEQLDHANLFIVPLDSHRTWYRFHHLFAELLRARLKEQQPEWIPNLHRQAACWYEANGFPFESMQHALLAEDLALATDVIERTVRKPATWSTGNIARMLEIVHTLPPAVIAARPWLRVYLSGILYVGGQPILADQMLAQVETSLFGLPQEMGEELALYTNAFRAFYAATLGDAPEAERRAEQVLGLVTEDDGRIYGHTQATLAQAAFTRGNVVRATQLYQKAVEHQKRNNARFTAVTWSSNLADVLALRGRLHEAEQVCLKTIAYGSQAGSPGSAVGYTQTFLAAILYEWNRLEEAEGMLRNGLRLMQQDGISPNFGRAHAMLAMVQQAQGKPADALESMEIARQIANRSQSRRYINRISAYQARLWLLQGESLRAGQWAEQWIASEQEQATPTYLNEFENLSAALIFYAESRLLDAEAILALILPSAEQAGRTGPLIEALAIQSLILNERPEGKAAAQQTLLRALRLSEPERYLRTYRTLGAPIAGLLSKLVCSDHAIQTYRDLLMGLFPSGEAVPSLQSVEQPAGMVEKLSDRELEILHLIASGMSNGQIAKKLYLTLNTIRAHSTHIFGKLGVHNRTEAVARAREMGLLK
jgi:LuxR family maltose regulon positive regulatory protein